MASIYDKLKKFTQPTVCTKDFKLKKSPRTIADYLTVIFQILSCLRTHLIAKNASIWTWKVNVVGKRQKKKPYQKREPKVTKRAKAAANDQKKESYWAKKKKMDKMDKKLEKVYDDLPKLLDDLQAKTDPGSDLFQLLSTRDQFWPTIKSLFDESDDSIIVKLKKDIAGIVDTLNLGDKKKIENRKGNVLFRCKEKMFLNCFKVFYDHGRKLRKLLKKRNVEELQREVMSENRNAAYSVQPTSVDEEMYELRDGELEKIYEEFPQIINNLKGMASPVSHLYHQLDLMEEQSGEEDATVPDSENDDDFLI